MKLPEKFTKYPWLTITLFAVVVMGMLYGLVDLFGPEWVSGQIERVLGESNIVGGDMK